MIMDTAVDSPIEVITSGIDRDQIRLIPVMTGVISIEPSGIGNPKLGAF